MSKKLEINKKTLRVLSADEIEAVAGGEDATVGTDLRSICGTQSAWTYAAQQPAAPASDDGVVIL